MSAPAGRRIRAHVAVALAALLAVLAALSGCAKKGPPSGGPPDLDPPRVIAALPESGAAGVPRDARLTVEFSEGMEPKSTGRYAGTCRSRGGPVTLPADWLGSIRARHSASQA